MKRLVAIALLFAVPLIARADTTAAPETDRDWPVLSKERIVLRTTMGDLVIALFPEAAPGHAEQILKLARLGVYDTTHFFKVDRDFAIQISGVARRRVPVSAEQTAAIHPLKAELNRHRHRYGTLSMAHDPGALDTAETSFLILLNDVPEMDGKFTVIGDVEAGHDVLEAIRNVAVDNLSRPIKRIEIESVVVVDADKLSSVGLRPAAASDLPALPEPLPERFMEVALGLTGAGLLILLISFFALTRPLRAIGMATFLVGFFQLFAVLSPAAPGSPGLALGMFGTSLLVFKMMTYFEAPGRMRG